MNLLSVNLLSVNLLYLPSKGYVRESDMSGGLRGDARTMLRVRRQGCVEEERGVRGGADGAVAAAVVRRGSQERAWLAALACLCASSKDVVDEGVVDRSTNRSRGLSYCSVSFGDKGRRLCFRRALVHIKP